MNRRNDHSWQNLCEYSYRHLTVVLRHSEIVNLAFKNKSVTASSWNQYNPSSLLY